MSKVEYGKWGTDPIHPKTLREFEYECIGNIHKDWNTGLSTNTIEKILREHNVHSFRYDYINEEIKMTQTHTAYKMIEAATAILSVLTTAEKVTPQRYVSPAISSRFQLLHFNTKTILEIITKGLK